MEKCKLCIDDETILNIYYTKPKAIPSLKLLGYATFPWNFDDSPEQDGVVIEPTAWCGGWLEVYNEVDTVVHEVGYLYLSATGFFDCPEKYIYICLT